jgi:hypothetical protein
MLAVPMAVQTVMPAPPAMMDEALFVFPNPVVGSARIRVHSTGAAALLTLVDPTGRHVLQMHEGALAQGEHTFVLDASALQPGAYSVRMEQDGNVTAVRLLIVP